MAKKKKVEGEIIDTKAIEEKALNYLFRNILGLS